MATLWSGLSPTLIMAVPSTSLYFTLYHALKEHIEDVCGGGWHSTILAPLVSGAIARTAVATVSSPLELVRTNMQSVRSGYSVAEGLRRELRCVLLLMSIGYAPPPPVFFIPHVHASQFTGCAAPQVAYEVCGGAWARRCCGTCRSAWCTGWHTKR